MAVRKDPAHPPDSLRQSPIDQTLTLLDAWWRTANYLSVGQVYLMGNPLLREPLTLAHIRPRLLAIAAPRRG